MALQVSNATSFHEGGDDDGLTTLIYVLVSVLLYAAVVAVTFPMARFHIPIFAFLLLILFPPLFIFFLFYLIFITIFVPTPVMVVSSSTTSTLSTSSSASPVYIAALPSSYTRGSATAAERSRQRV
jgi:hypothetical protein